MDRFDEDMFEESAFDEADDSADEFDQYDDGFDEGDGFDEMSPGLAFDEGDEFDEGDDGFDEGDEFDQPAAFDEAYDEESEEADGFEEALDEALGAALGAEDSDEFFRRIAQGLRGAVGAVRRAAPTIGRIARTVAPIASLIPGVGTAVGQVANVVGQLMADEASEEEALDAFAELAVRNRAARPIAAALAARTVLGARGAAALPRPMRVQAVRQVRAATRQLVRQGGPTAVRALPRIARSVRRASVTRRTPAIARPRVLVNTVRRLAQRSPQLRQRLSRPSPAGRTVIARARAAARAGASPAARALGQTPQRYRHRHHGHGGYAGGYGWPAWGGGQRRIVLRGPTTIVIRP